MPKRKDLKLDEYNISTYCYRELYNFCMQHRERLARLNNCYGVSSPTFSDTRGGVVTDPTSRAAMVAMQIRQDVEVIRRSAQQTSPLYWKQLLKAVTEPDVRFETLRDFEGLRLNEKEFHKLRRRFFYILAKNLNKI